MDVKEYLELYNKSLDNDEEARQKVIEYNKALTTEYPFLIPRNRWTGDITEDYDYTYTEMDSMPDGWRIAFGDDLLRDLKAELVKANSLDDYRIMQIKEKFGGLRWYDSGCTEDWIRTILPKYERLSANTCIICGEPATHVSLGWIEYYCEDCAKRQYNSILDSDRKHGYKEVNLPSFEQEYALKESFDDNEEETI